MSGRYSRTRSSTSFANKLLGSQSKITESGGVEIDRGQTQVFTVLHPKLMRLFQDDLERLKLGLDSLTQDLLRNAGVFTSELYKGYWKGIDVFTSPVIPTPTGTEDWPIPIFMRKHVSYSPAQQIANVFDPNTNQTSPNWGIRMLSNWGRVEVNKTMGVLGKIASA